MQKKILDTFLIKSIHIVYKVFKKNDPPIKILSIFDKSL